MSNYQDNKLHIYNSLTGKKEKLKPINEKSVGMYVCGPTVYSNVHLGNVRTFMSFDIIYRYLLHLGYKVRYVRNITDAGHLENDSDNGEDRISKKARLEEIEPMEVVQKYTVDFHNTLNQFNLLPPSIEPTATGHIIEQIEIIKTILKKKLAYEVNGSIYFDVIKYNKTNNYGILSLPVNKIKELITASRIETIYTKEELLLLYLNSVPFGENVYGVEAAARRYFNISASQLKIEESAVLVGLLKANTYLDGSYRTL